MWNRGITNRIIDCYLLLNTSQLARHTRKRKKVSNDRELVQSEPYLCPPNQNEPKWDTTKITNRHRVKSWNFGHRVNLDTHLQTVESQMSYEPSHQDFHCLLSWLLFLF